MPTNKKRPGPPPNIPQWKVERLIEKAKTEASNEATSLTICLMLLVLQDKFGMEDSINDVLAEWNKYAEKVMNKEIKLHEVRDVLRREYEIQI